MVEEFKVGDVVRLNETAHPMYVGRVLIIKNVRDTNIEDQDGTYWSIETKNHVDYLGRLEGLAKSSEVREFNGVTSTKLPRLELIPKSTLELLAARFELGIERKGYGAWNALRTDFNTTAIINDKFVLDRLSHCIHHCYDAIGKIVRGVPLEGEEDAGAILFAGSVLGEYKRVRREQWKKEEAQG